MTGGVYVLCALTSLVCTVLLWRDYRGTGMRLLLWGSLCFAGLTIDNVLLYVDLMVGPSYDLSNLPLVAGLASVSLLLVGLVWELP